MAEKRQVLTWEYLSSEATRQRLNLIQTPGGNLHMSIVAIPNYFNQRFTRVEFLRCFGVVFQNDLYLITIDGTMDQILYREVLEKYFIPELKAAELLGLFFSRRELI